MATIVGGTVACILVVLIAMLAVLCLRWRRRKRASSAPEKNSSNTATITTNRDKLNEAVVVGGEAMRGSSPPLVHAADGSITRSMAQQQVVGSDDHAETAVCTGDEHSSTMHAGMGTLEALSEMHSEPSGAPQSTERVCFLRAVLYFWL